MPVRPAPALQLVYDTGALIASQRNDRRMWAIHERALQRGIQPVVPSGCLVESWAGRLQVNLSRLLDGCEVESLATHSAKRAGEMRNGLGRDVSAVDASVAESALRRRAAVVTSDRDDIELLSQSAGRKTSIIDI
jgi:predicted nucleic acid-binding protein